jgi:chorismate synthase
MGAVCRRFLEPFGIGIGSYVLSIGAVRAALAADPDFPGLFSLAETSPVRCPDHAASEKMLEEIDRARAAGDTLGGVFDCVALNLPPGLGSHVHWDRRLTARLMAAVGSIPAIKGVQFGEAFDNAARLGTEVHDEIICDTAGNLKRSANRAGGLEGGMTTGEPLIVRAAMKPISTTLKGLGSVDLATGQPARTMYERSDICAAPRASVVAEAMVSFVLANALMEKLGGDSLEEMTTRYKTFNRGRISELPMDNTTWRFGYKTPSEE